MLALFLSLLLNACSGAAELDASLDQAMPSDHASEVAMLQVGLVRRWGYPVEQHEVTTQDGYILDLIRIPRGRADDRNISRPAMLLVHGLLESGTQWILNLPEQSAGFIYADGGLDIFIANVRGSTYGRRHLKLDPDNDTEFWNYSFDEMARYDLPAIIDKTLAVSGQKQLYYMGHSQGTLISLLLLADRPRYNDKIKQLFLLSPIATGHYIRGLLQVLISAYRPFWPVTEVFRLFLGSRELLGHNTMFIGSVGTILCDLLPVQEGCYDAMYLLLGPPDFAHFNKSRVAVYASSLPAGTSTRTILHWGQIASHESVARYDYNNPVENLLHYGQRRPPVYNYTEIEVPMYMFWSRNDWLTTPSDIQKDLLPNLRKGLVKGAFEIPEYNHLDFVLATNAAEKVYTPVLKLINENEDHED